MIHDAILIVGGICVGHFVPNAYVWLSKQFSSAKTAVEAEVKKVGG